jgi:hypothetical protein
VVYEPYVKVGGSPGSGCDRVSLKENAPSCAERIPCPSHLSSIAQARCEVFASCEHVLGTTRGNAYLAPREVPYVDGLSSSRIGVRSGR